MKKDCKNNERKKNHSPFISILHTQLCIYFINETYLLLILGWRDIFSIEEMIGTIMERKSKSLSQHRYRCWGQINQTTN